MCPEYIFGLSIPLESRAIRDVGRGSRRKLVVPTAVAPRPKTATATNNKQDVVVFFSAASTNF